MDACILATDSKLCRLGDKPELGRETILAPDFGVCFGVIIKPMDILEC